MAMTPRQMELFNDAAYIRNIKTVEREVLANYREALVKIRADIAKIYEKHAKDGVLTLAEMTKYNRLTSLEKQLTQDIAPTLAKNRVTTAKLQVDEYGEAFFRTAWTIDQQVGVSLKWGLLNPKAVNAAVANRFENLAIKRLRKGTISSLRTAITQGLIRGQSFPAMMRGIRGAINGSASDAMRIVRTEGQRAQVLGQQANYAEAKELGVDVQEVWDAVLDSRTRFMPKDKADHRRMNNRLKTDEGYDATDTGGGGFINGPLQSGIAAFDIFCRCRTRGQVEGFEPDLKGPEIQSQETYSQWQARTGR